MEKRKSKDTGKEEMDGGRDRGDKEESHSKIFQVIRDNQN